MPADDYTDPAPATAFAHWIRQQTWNVSWYNWVFIQPLTHLLQAHCLAPEIVGEEHYAVAAEVNAFFNVTMNCKILLLSLVWMSISDEERPWLLVPVVSSSSCRKTSIVAEQFTGQPGSYVPVAETVRGFKEILDGKHDHLPEDAFRGVGSIEDVIAKAEKMGFKR